MIVYVRVNQVGWVHLWTSREAYEQGEASVHCFNGRIDPRWNELELDDDLRARLKAAELVAMEDPGYLDELDAES